MKGHSLTHRSQVQRVMLKTKTIVNDTYTHNREMRTVIKDQKSEWCAVKSVVPQGSVEII